MGKLKFTLLLRFLPSVTYMILCLLGATAIWAAIFIPGAAAGGIAGRLRTDDNNVSIVPGIVSQIVFIVLSLIILIYYGNFSKIWSTRPLQYTLQAIFLSIILSIIIFIIIIKISGKDYNPQFLPRNLLETVIIAGLLAPLGEELLYRGAVESYLLMHGSVATAVIYPSILFAIMHIAPFHDAPKTYLATVLIGAFLLGLLAGYYRSISGSLVPAIAAHSTANITGFSIYNLFKSLTNSPEASYLVQITTEG